MHVAEGVLSGPVLVTGALLAAAGVGAGLYRMRAEEVPRVAVISSALFVASLVHLPGPVSVHLVLIGMAGIVLKWGAFPAYFVALVFQVMLFGYGGVSVLGVNVFTMAAASVLSGGLFRAVFNPARARRALLAGFLAGAGGVVLGALLVSLALLASGKSFTVAAAAVLVAHLPVALAEGLVTGWAVVFLTRVRPAILGSEPMTREKG